MANVTEVLEVRRGTEIREYPLTSQTIRIGRGAENDVVVIDAFTSRRHANLKWHQGSLCVVDLASTNGTVLNNKKLESHVPYPIREGDVITIGDFKLTLLVKKGIQYDQTYVAPARKAWWYEAARSKAVYAGMAVIVIAVLATLIATRAIPIDISFGSQPSVNSTSTATPVPVKIPEVQAAPSNPSNPSTPTSTLAAKISPAVMKIQWTEGKIVHFGSGVVIDKAGYILTAEHVVANTDTVKAVSTDGNTYFCKVIARDTILDLAIVKIIGNESDYPTAEIGDSSKTTTAEDVIILGYPLSEFNVSKGIISGFVEESGVHYMKTDAAVNHGNSGGPVINQSGQIIGIMVLKAFKEPGPKVDATVVEGISYAVCINEAKMFIADNVGK